ncbi:hypothetical protein SDC9_155163 [bioreactor metagenome]|uniref:Uncharacterized protein n=1 Tax=bioreactor metagenome TaxID=1076179 RepID=A0A645F0T5_9ZZZZ
MNVMLIRVPLRILVGIPVVIINARVLFHRFHHRHPLPGSRHIDFSPLIGNDVASRYLVGKGRIEFLDKFHHILIIGISLIQFNRGKFRVMLYAHSLVTEYTADFIYLFKSSDNQAFQIELGFDTQIHIDIQRIMMRNKRTGCRADFQCVKHRGIDFQISPRIQKLAY